MEATKRTKGTMFFKYIQILAYAEMTTLQQERKIHRKSVETSRRDRENETPVK